MFYYNRLPFGISISPSVFQKIMETVLQGIPGVVCFQDDILVTGKTKEEHVNCLRRVLERLNDCGLKIKRSKCVFFQKSVSYLGHVMDKDGLKKSDEKVRAIIEAPIPENKQQLKAYLGLVNYYRKFIPNMATVAHSLYNLLREDVDWIWSNECQASFNRLQNIIASEDILVHYNPKLKLKLACDASNYGLGAVLSHVFDNGVEKPICFASRTLSESEKKYSQINKEALALVFGVNKFHQYLFGRKFTLVTDSKPLLTIFGDKKGIPQMAANRLQRYAWLLSGYNYDIEYVKSEKNVSDCFSRLPLNYVASEEEFADSYSYINYVEKANIGLSLNSVRIETKSDEILKLVIEYVQNGDWPNHISDKIKPYFSKKEELTVESEILMWGYKVVVPRNLKNLLLTELHRSHMGIVKTKSLARSYVWWPTINNDIERLIKGREICLQHKPNPEISPLIPWKYPDGPWERIHIDFLGPFKDKTYLVIINAFSKWMEVIPMAKTTSYHTIEKIHEIFCRFGFPKVLVSDNSTQLCSTVSKLFRKICNRA